MIYRYDNTFPGFLSAVWQVYHDGTSRMEAISPAGEGPSLFHEEVTVPADAGKAEDVLAALARDCGGRAVHLLYYAFLSEAPHREAVLFRYLKEGFRRKKGLWHCRKEPWMWTAAEWAERTGNESHRMWGLLRFRELKGGLFYGEMAPDCDILALTAGHFVRRMAGHSWAIHDVKRHRAVLYDGKEMVIADVTEAWTPELSRDEEAFSNLWKEYYRHIAITERYNPGLRRSFMPEKYWAFLPEMEEGQ